MEVSVEHIQSNAVRGNYKDNFVWGFVVRPYSKPYFHAFSCLFPPKEDGAEGIL